MSKVEQKIKSKTHTIRSYKVRFNVKFFCNEEERLNMTVREFSQLRSKAEKLGYGKELANVIQDYIQSHLPDKIGCWVEHYSP